jgi:protein-disulfide isomerase
MFLDQAHLTEPDLASVMHSIGADRSAYDACMSGRSHAKVQDDVAEARRLGVTGTPTFFVGTTEQSGFVKVKRVLTGAQGAPDFRAVLDSLLR